MVVERLLGRGVAISTIHRFPGGQTFSRLGITIPQVLFDVTMAGTVSEQIVLVDALPRKQQLVQCLPITQVCPAE